MSYAGSEFYDNDDNFAVYMQHRHRPENPNDTLEKPVLLALLGNVEGKDILDLGCGDASLALELFRNKASAYTGLEGSRNMVARAQQTLAETVGTIIHTNIETWEYPNNQYDLVISRLVFHYLPTLSIVFAKVYRALKPGGLFVFSIEHPVITCCDRAWQSGGARQDWIVDNYFDVGLRETRWLGSQVIKYHRTIEDYFLELQETGFVVKSLRESRPERRWFEHDETYKRRRRIPLFLIMAAQRLEPSSV